MQADVSKGGVFSTLAVRVSLMVTGLIAIGSFLIAVVAPPNVDAKLTTQSALASFFIAAIGGVLIAASLLIGPAWRYAERARWALDRTRDLQRMQMIEAHDDATSSNYVAALEDLAEAVSVALKDYDEGASSYMQSAGVRDALRIVSEYERYPVYVGDDIGAVEEQPTRKLLAPALG